MRYCGSLGHKQDDESGFVSEGAALKILSDVVGMIGTLGRDSGGA